MKTKLNRNGMSKRNREMFIVVMEALKASDCIIGYSLTEQGVIPEWKEGGIERTFRELTTNTKPFGLKKSHRGTLMQALPKNEQEKICSAFMEQFGRPSNLPAS